MVAECDKGVVEKRAGMESNDRLKRCEHSLAFDKCEQALTSNGNGLIQCFLEMWALSLR
jgi:hypothetical protein